MPDDFDVSDLFENDDDPALVGLDTPAAAPATIADRFSAIGRFVVFDIETEPRPARELSALCPPVEHPPRPEPFHESQVKLGRMKDPDKIKAKIDSEREKREKEIADYEKDKDKRAKDWFASFVEKSPLSPITGRILSIGFFVRGTEDPVVILESPDEKSEKAALVMFWDVAATVRNNQGEMIGFNSERFDLPFICTRTIMHGLKVPDWFLEQGRYQSKTFVDLMKILSWGAYGYQIGLSGFSGSGGLDAICRGFGLEGKSEEGMTGADFHKLYRTKGEKTRALNYLRGDVIATNRLAERLGH